MVVGSSIGPVLSSAFDQVYSTRYEFPPTGEPQIYLESDWLHLGPIFKVKISYSGTPFWK